MHAYRNNMLAHLPHRAKVDDALLVAVLLRQLQQLLVGLQRALGGGRGITLGRWRQWC